MLRDYASVPDEGLARKIAKHLEALTYDEEALRVAVKKPSLGAEFFDALSSYVRVRNTRLAREIEMELFGMKEKPLFSHKRIFEHVMGGGYLPVNGRALVLGVSIEALKDGLRKLAKGFSRAEERTEFVAEGAELYDYLITKGELLGKAAKELASIVGKRRLLSSILEGGVARRVILAQALVRGLVDGRFRITDGELGDVVERSE